MCDKSIIPKENTSIKIEAKPSFLENNIPVVFATDDGFTHLLGVAIQSIISNSSINNNYDIFILDGGIALDNKSKIEELVKDKANFNITYLDMELYLKDFDTSLLSSSNRFPLVIWYRIFIPKIFKNFAKIIYLDCDLVLLTDISELFNTNMHGHALAACKEYLDFSKHLEEFLPLKDANNYFCSGTLLLNIGKLLSISLEEQCLEKLKEIKTQWCPDQDILNVVCENDVEFLDYRWVVIWLRDENIAFLPQGKKDEILKAYASPKIVHYAGKKPTECVGCSLKDYFWKYAEQTPFYKYCQNRLVDTLILELEEGDANMGKNPAHDLIRKTIWKCLILASIAFGEEKDKYLSACVQYEDMLEKMQSSQTKTAT